MPTETTGTPSDIGLIGLAVMGQNLVLNMADHGYAVSVYNRTTSTMQRFLDQSHASEPSAERVHGYAELEDFVKSIKRPRKVVILVKSSAVLPQDRDAVDKVIEQLTPLLERGDIIIDGGNSNWNATIRREEALSAAGFNFIGTGVSGGEVGARFGPSLMPGGTREAWESLEPIWKAIAAKIDPRSGKPLEDYAPGRPVTEGEPCTAYIGPGGAGHYVKMVHNGIEYIDMQLICEAYHLMKDLLGMSAGEMSEVFGSWNEGDLDSFLIEITTDILRQKDPAGKHDFFVDAVLDTAGQKGTGKWTAQNALDMGVPANALAEAVFARFISAIKEERVEASKTLPGPKQTRFDGDRGQALEMIRQALYCSKICAYAQGFQLMARSQAEYGWELDFGAIAQIWRGGCIIRARFLQKIAEAFSRDESLANLLLDPYFAEEMERRQANWRRVASTAVSAGIPTPAFSASLAYFDSYRTETLPANLLQAQRDYFGAHSYERVDQPRGKHFHLDWPEPDRPQIEV